jgi:DNA-binding winged helix-turn-helix (wHTH) protein
MNVRFGEFRLDSESRQLLRSDVEVHLSPKAFELLRALLEVRPRALAKAELCGLLWPDTFVSEGNLSVLIAEIRRVLGESPHEAGFVRTVHRFGYAFSGAAVDVQSPGQMVGGGTWWLINGQTRIALASGDNLVGRDPQLAVWLNVPGVSRRHACITIGDRSATLADLASKNGTYLRGARISSPMPLADGDQIRIGPVTLTFRIWSPQSSTDTQHLNGGAVFPSS